MKHHNMRARYEAAETLLTKHTRTAVLNGNPKIHWNADGTAFQYERQERSGSEVTSVLSEVNGMDGTRKMIQKAEKAGQAANAGSASGCSEERAVTMSPDGAYHLSYDRHNLILTEQKTGEQSQLTFDGEPDLEYGCYIDIYSQITVKRQGYQEHPQVLWSPDGTRFITYRADRRTTKKLPLIASYSDGLHDLRPELYEYPCPFVTDSDEEIPHYSLYIGSLADKTLVKADAPDFLYPVFTSPEKSTVKWMEDSRHFYFTWIARGYQEACLYLGDAQNRSCHVVIRETTEQFFNLGAFGLLDGYGSYLFSNFITSDRAYAFWQSERNGFAHLYRYRLTENESVCEGDLFDASEKELIVQKLIRVDEQDKQIYFMANNVPDCPDPMYYQLYRIGFDGSGLTRLTPEDAVHQVSMGSQSFVDTYSRVDLPPVTVLRKLDGTLICELEKADISNLLKLGYQIPERITLTAADGKTTLYGIFFRPDPVVADCQEEETAEGLDFELRQQKDGKDSWPLIDYIYGGAQLYNVPREFTWDNGMNREIFGGLQSFAKLGFAGLILDGRGVPGRGMEFHSFSYHNIHACAGLADHVFCLKELKQRYPQIDLDRVGMWGNSAGGYATVSAMLQYPGVYCAGVASSGNYDQRVYEHSWTERYNGLYTEEVYQYGDITRLAGNLKGHLMLAYGAMDDNVTMAQTLRLCDELNAHNKRYELVVLPRCNHNVPSDAYFVRRKMDYFVRNLLEAEDPGIFEE
ncbi:MAG: DPP IV N-terminal domain-containing protein [Clostridiaceae bacterium]|nr:DPP IV N-terminal domain-containing protein [Clostridiaceae bacterium]